MANRVTAEKKRILFEYVKYEDGNTKGAWTCTKCSHKAMGRPNRMESHLLCRKNNDVKICTYMEKNPNEREELARRLGRNPHPEKTPNTNGLGSEMLNSMHQGQSSRLDSTHPSFPQANPDQREELAKRLVETNAVCSQMINTKHQGQSSQFDSTQPFFPQANPNEMEELARGLKPQPEQIVIPMDETCSTGALLEYNNDGVEETNAVGSKMINTTHQRQSSQPDSPLSFFPQRGIHMHMDDPILTPSQVDYDHLNDHDMHASQDEETVDSSRAVDSMGIEGQQQLQPEEDDDIVNDLGDTEISSLRAVISSVRANQEHHSNVPDLGSAGHEGGASPDVRMQNAVSQEKGSKRRKCAPSSGASATALQLDNSERSSSISVSNLIISPSDAYMSVPRETRIPPNNGQERACVPNTNSSVVQGRNDVDFEPNNTIHLGQSSLPDSVQVSSPQEGMSMGLGDQIPHPPQGNSDHVNDQDTHPLQDGAGIDALTPGNTFGIGLANEPGLADPPPCPPDFPSDLWDFYLKIDKCYYLCKQKKSDAFCRHEKDHLNILASACAKVRDYFANFPGSDTAYLCYKLYTIYYRKKRKIKVNNFIPTIYVLERQIRKEAEQEVPMLATKRKMEMNRWLTYAACFKTEVDNLDIDAMKAKSPTDILQLLERVEDLGKGVRKLIETGKSLLDPVPNDLLSWNTSFMSYGSQLQNQMLLGQSPQPV